MDILVSEILAEFKNANKGKEKKNVLIKYKDNKALIHVMELGFRKDVEYYTTNIPEYAPDKMKVGLSESNLRIELERIYIYIANDPKSKKLTTERRNELLIQALESLHKDEAKILESIILKEFKIPYLTEKLVEEVWPGLLPNDIKK